METFLIFSKEKCLSFRVTVVQQQLSRVGFIGRTTVKAAEQVKSGETTWSPQDRDEGQHIRMQGQYF